MFAPWLYLTALLGPCCQGYNVEITLFNQLVVLNKISNGYSISIKSSSDNTLAFSVLLFFPPQLETFCLCLENA